MNVFSTKTSSVLLKKTRNNPSADGYRSSLTNNIGILFFGLFNPARAGLLVLLFVYFNANASSPSANIKGPLKAHLSDGSIIITSEIVADASPVVSYTLINNSNGASISTQGPLVYDNTTGAYLQTVIVKPGATAGRFNIKLTVTTPGGTTEASAGVTVVN